MKEIEISQKWMSNFFFIWLAINYFTKFFEINQVKLIAVLVIYFQELSLWTFSRNYPSFSYNEYCRPMSEGVIDWLCGADRWDFDS